MIRLLGLVIASATAAVLFYISRFWEFRLWRGNLLEIEGLRAQGDLVAVWTRGTDLAPFSLLLWILGGFVLLTILQKLWDLLFTPKGDP